MSHSSYDYINGSLSNFFINRHEGTKIHISKNALDLLHLCRVIKIKQKSRKTWLVLHLPKLLVYDMFLQKTRKPKI